MLIRIEIPVDAMGIDHLLRKTFPSNDEADLVYQLRENGQLVLGIVATDDEGGVVGYVAFSPVDLEGEDRHWVALAPVAVAEEYRRQGIAQALIYEGLDALNEFGYAAVVVLGEPAYYGRLGFKTAADYHLRCRWQGSEQAFQVYPLAESALERATGLVNFSAPFDRF